MSTINIKINTNVMGLNKGNGTCRMLFASGDHQDLAVLHLTVS